MQFNSSEQTSHLVPMQAFHAIFSGYMKVLGLAYLMTGEKESKQLFLLHRDF